MELPDIKYEVDGTSHDGFVLHYEDLTYSEALEICEEAGMNPNLCINKIRVCSCGRDVMLIGFTNTCDCGKEYNMSGQELTLHEEWGSETGENYLDIIN